MIWKTRKVSSFADVITGGTPSTSIQKYREGGTIPWLNSGDLNQGIITRAKNFITEDGLKNSSTKLMPYDSVLIALTGSTTGVSAIMKMEACANQSVTGILPSKYHHPEFLYFFFKTQKNIIFKKAWGGAQPHINQKFIKDYLVPLPPLDEQIRVATILGNAEILISKRKESILLLEEFLKSKFWEMFGKNKYTAVPLENLIDIQSGQVSPNENPYREMYHVGGANIESNTGLLLNLKLAKDENLISGKYLFTKDHILYSKIRPYLNKVAIPDFTGICSADIYPIKPKTDLINKHFLRFILTSDKFLAYALKQSDRANIPKVNRNALNNFKISLPEINQQNVFGQIVEKADLLKNNLQNSLIYIENVYKSISERAFSGNLDLSKVLLETNSEFSIAEGDHIVPVEVTHNKSTIPSKAVSDMTLDEYYNIPEEVQDRYGSIDQHVFDWEFFLKKHFIDRSIVTEDVANLFNKIYYDDGLSFDYNHFKNFVFKELKSRTSFLEQNFDDKIDKKISLTVKDEASQT